MPHGRDKEKLYHFGVVLSIWCIISVLEQRQVVKFLVQNVNETEHGHGWKRATEV